MNQAVYKQTLALDELTWTPVTPRWDCNNVAVRNLTNHEIELRTDVDDESTSDTIEPQGQELYAGPLAAGSVRTFRFFKGIPIIFLRSASGAGPTQVRVTFLI